MPDPLAHSPDILTSPSLIIGGLSYQIAYCRDRVLHGDWTEKFARERIKLCICIADDNLRIIHACTNVEVYANLTTGCRALLSWSYTDRNGNEKAGSDYCTLDKR